MIRISSALNRETTRFTNERKISSANSRLIQTPNSSVRSKRYSIRSKQSSDIDETLFGKIMQTNNNSTAILNDSVKNSKPRYSSIRSIKCNKSSEPFLVITNDNVRNLREIKPADAERFLTLNQSQYQKLLNYQKKSDDSKHLKKAQQIESLQRKEEFRNYDNLRKQKETLSDLQKEKLAQDEIIIKKAWDARIDNDFELREINEMIENAKVQSIRAHQVAEKAVIRNEIFEDDRRLNKKIENETMKDMKEQHDRDKKRLRNEYLAAISMYDQNYNKNKQYLADLKSQADENLLTKQSILDAIEKSKLSEAINMKKQQKLRQELIQDYHDSQERKRIERLEEKNFNKKIMEMQKAKAEKEIAEEEALIMKKHLREKEYAKLRAMQQRFKCLQSERDELLERRAIEQTQRKWRQKELDEIIRQREIEDDLRRARICQREEAIETKILELKRDEKEFHKYVEDQKILIEKEKNDSKMKKTKKDIYTTEIMNQIEQNKIQKIVDNYRIALEQNAIVNENNHKRNRLNEIKLRKLEELKQLGVDEVFIKPIKNYIHNLKFLDHIT